MSESGKYLDLEAYIPGIEVISVLGSGGMGAVFKARQVNLDREVAIKLLGDQWQDDTEIFEMFQREARAMAKLSHPNLVGVYDFGIIEEVGTAYLMMEYVRGETVHSILTREGIDEPNIAGILAQVAAGIDYAHKQGVVHLDIKPANIMVNTEAKVKVLDFGLATIANERGQSGGGASNFGTPDYAAPEMYGETPSPDHRSDIYATGAVLYELLTGAPPQGQFRPASEVAGTNPAFDNIVNTCMQANKEDRFQSMAELGKALVAAAKCKPKAKPLAVNRLTTGSVPAAATQAAVAATAAKMRKEQAKAQTASIIRAMVILIILGTLAVFGLVQMKKNRLRNQAPPEEPKKEASARETETRNGPSRGIGSGAGSGGPGANRLAHGPRTPAPAGLDAESLGHLGLTLLGSSASNGLKFPEAYPTWRDGRPYSPRHGAWRVDTRFTAPNLEDIPEQGGLWITEVGTGLAGFNLLVCDDGGQLTCAGVGINSAGEAFQLIHPITPGSEVQATLHYASSRTADPHIGLEIDGNYQQFDYQSERWFALTNGDAFGRDISGEHGGCRNQAARPRRQQHGQL